ncbi:hypothetical protein [Streptomyces sp. NPDC006335]|uniref:hypothetical protein n=1 Tax=Streptomyces sp. NPDC006335 TaxID=3156895 RepID=UPI0033B5E2EF
MTSKRDSKIAAMLRAGATYDEVRRQLKVGNTAIIRVRYSYTITSPRAKRSADDLARAEAQAVGMLRAGATHASIRAATGLNSNKIAELRRENRIPIPLKNRKPRLVAVDEAFRSYTRSGTDGHVLWIKPAGSRTFDFKASGGRYNARRLAFEQHHGRPPEGRLRRTPDCAIPNCIAGAHHADNRISDRHGSPYEPGSDRPTLTSCPSPTSPLAAS